MRRNIKTIILSVIMTLTISGCGNASTNSSKPHSSEETIRNYPDATMWVASAIKIDASEYFYKGSIHPHIIYDIIRDDGEFGSYLLNNHPDLKEMEYVIEFETRGPCNVFCLQKNTAPVTIGCDGKYTKLSDWGFETWDDVLEHYNLNNN